MQHVHKAQSLVYDNTCSACAIGSGIQVAAFVPLNLTRIAHA